MIEPVRFSEWATPIGPVLKADGNIRICGDYKQTVNRVSHLEQYPIPTLDDLCEKLTGGKMFSKLDLSNAYAQLPLDESSKEYVTINTHKGLFRYNRLPFGISSAPAIFQRTMENILQGITQVAVYLDDIIVAGGSKTQHLETLDLVLGRLGEAGLRLKEKKCAFSKEEVQYLGHRIDQDGLHPVQDKVDAIQCARKPENVSELKAYVGLLNYYGKFLSNISTVLAPLHKLLCKRVKWFWGPTQRHSIEQSKRMLLSVNCLVHYDPSKKILLQCDASEYGLGVVQSHTMEDGTEGPVGFASRTLNSAERNYSQLDKEGAAIMFALKKFHKQLYGRHFVITTDHLPLISLFSELKQVPTTASPRVQRWVITLRGYEYEIKFKSGKDNSNDDCPSRLSLPVTVPEVHEERVLLIEELDASPITSEEISRYTRRDPMLAHVHEYLMRGWPDGENSVELSAYTCRRDEMSVQDGCVLWGARVVIPQQCRQAVMQELHLAHPGINRMKSLARSYVWWPAMDNELEKLSKQCELCQLHSRSSPTAPLQPWEWPEKPWTRVHIYYSGPFLGKMWLVAVDATSKWIEAHIMNSTTSFSTVNKLREMFAKHGLPEVIVSDNAANFVGEEFETFMRRNGIVHVTSAPFHPSLNGLGERAVQTLTFVIVKTEGDTLDVKLQRFLFDYRRTPHSTTGKSPMEVLNKRKMRSRLDLLQPSLQGHVRKKQTQMNMDHDRGTRKREFAPGDNVYVKNFGPGLKWLTGTIRHVTGPVSHTVELADGRECRRHVDHLRGRCVDTDSGSETTSCPKRHRESGDR